MSLGIAKSEKMERLSYKRLNTSHQIAKFLVEELKIALANSLGGASFSLNTHVPLRKFCISSFLFVSSMLLLPPVINAINNLVHRISISSFHPLINRPVKCRCRLAPAAGSRPSGLIQNPAVNGDGRYRTGKHAGTSRQRGRCAATSVRMILASSSVVLHLNICSCCLIHFSCRYTIYYIIVNVSSDFHDMETHIYGRARFEPDQLSVLELKSQQLISILKATSFVGVK